jgi:hypothetical protein
VLYHFPFVGGRLVTGKFCAIARGVRFIMNGAQYALSGAQLLCPSLASRRLRQGVLDALAHWIR